MAKSSFFFFICICEGVAPKLYIRLHNLVQGSVELHRRITHTHIVMSNLAELHPRNTHALQGPISAVHHTAESSDRDMFMHIWDIAEKLREKSRIFIAQIFTENPRFSFWFLSSFVLTVLERVGAVYYR